MKISHSFNKTFGNSSSNILLLDESDQEFEELVSDDSSVWSSAIASLAVAVAGDKLQIEILLLNEGFFDSLKLGLGQFL